MGTIIGAGFSSGQEVYKFFTRFGDMSFYGTICAGILFVLIGACTLYKIYDKDIGSYRTYLEGVVGGKIAAAVEILTYIFMMSTVCIMFSGSGAIFNQKFNFPYWAGVFIMMALTYFFLCFGAEGLIMVNKLLTPFMIVGITLLAIYSIATKSAEVFSNIHIPVARETFSALLYISYNCLGLVPIMAPLKGYISGKKTAIRAGAFGGGIIFIMLFLINLSLYLFPEAHGFQIPLLRISQILNPYVEWIYFFIIIAAMLTTAVGDSFAILNSSFIPKKIPKKASALILCLLSIPLSLVGFSTLVGNLFAFFGFLGLFILFLILAA